MHKQSFFYKIKKYAFDPQLRFNYLTAKGMTNSMSDKAWIKKKWKLLTGRRINLNSPVGFNEKLQWLKLYDHNPMYTKLVDKYSAKSIVASKIGKEYIIPTLGVWNNFDDINFEKLPNSFVLKTTHDSGGVVVCKDKGSFDKEKAREVINQSMKRNYFYMGREWQYKNVKPRIIAEKYIDENGHSPEDYKILCFNGRPDNIMVCTERESGTTKFYFFDSNWRLLRINKWGKKAPSDFTLPKPSNLDKMFEIAQKLSTGIPLVRVDLYNVDGQIYFGETTFYPDSGFDMNLSKDCDIDFGNKLDLSKVKS